MFRNPRENRKLAPTSKIAPSVGRPPSPPHSNPSTGAMAAKTASKATTPKPKSASEHPSKLQTTLVESKWAKKSPANNGFKGKPKGTPNGNIMSFFKKAEEINNRLFLQDKKDNGTIVLSDAEDEDVDWKYEDNDGVMTNGHNDDGQERYNENEVSVKRRKVSEEVPVRACSPPPPEAGEAPALEALPRGATTRPGPARRKTGPFVDDSDSDAEEELILPPRRSLPDATKPSLQSDASKSPDVLASDQDKSSALPTRKPPLLKAESTSQFGGEDFEDFEDLEDEEFLEGEEYDERRWMQEQQRLEMAEAGFEGDADDFEAIPMFPDNQLNDEGDIEMDEESTASCPICEANLAGLTDQQSLVHVNGCLDGNPVPLPQPKESEKSTTPLSNNNSKMFKRPPRPAKAGQDNPFQLGQPSTGPKSAFSTLMAGHAEDRAWATAAAEQTKARGKPAYQRTCPFYKIMPGFFIAVDAFRYGAVRGQNAYFLSHFHSDHYIGLTSSWSHGPIYCSRVTANLVRQQLRVDPKWVVDLEFERKTEVPGTQGVHVTMIPANHCPGSSLFLFEKEMSKGKNPKLQRVLHCGDFRACRAHVGHPLLRPDVLDVVSGKTRQQKLDACYLDTTYLNPKYAFPPQQQVIQACADMCVSLNKVRTDESDGWEQMKRERAGEGMVKFVRKGSDIKKEEEEVVKEPSPTKPGSGAMRGRLLVIVGTYSIGKERICVGIAKALGSKIFAAKGKTRICHALEDPELNALLTSDPREAQVHMTPLFEIRADTLDDYLRDYSDHFSRAVGFRPSGWNYRPPNSRFTESPSVQTVLHSQNWKSQFSMRDLTPQRGSTSRASCFGVPYSEHSSFRELTMFCCALRIDKIIPTVNVGSAKSREKMKAWCERWAQDKKKNGLFKLADDGSCWD
ncbi:DNA repair metallo-beta-lactamase-domain-containing protein [Lophiotrema nucula]|uniref:DNA repair metallo-beta-lactamase-domain-containing protein n=1 Tax=Lophiotrema nucula TaxID=690887 RepID=A0A6A5YK65_9PLEO|nr:DNA repair metallo-beta-lactamase-domain-containing protein [Lophiotrema nucula]